MKKQVESGFHLVIIIVIVAVILVGLGIAFFTAVQNKSDGDIGKFIADVANNPSEPDLKIKHIGIDLGYYDTATNRAGDVVFTKEGIEQYGNLIFTNYGEVSKANSARPTDTLNPQPTFIIPLGTKIHSLVDGVVVRIENLYSNDQTIMVASSAESNWIYETEHVINPVVKVGDQVKAGQVIAEASTHDSQYHPGFGLYEIGILKGGNPPEHVCLFNYLDDSIKEDTFAKLRAFYTSWEAYIGDDTLYDESKMVVPGCYTPDPIGDTNQGNTN
jgi:biotin carboxyl carrier protein